jgi:hypothetical protein
MLSRPMSDQSCTLYMHLLDMNWLLGLLKRQVQLGTNQGGIHQTKHRFKERFYTYVKKFAYSI